MYRTAKLGFPVILCLVAVSLFTCGKDNPTSSSRQEATAPKAAARPQTTAAGPQTTAAGPQATATGPQGTVTGPQGTVAGQAGQATEQATSPDYVIESVEVSESSLSAGQRFSMTATVKNQGVDYPGFDLATLRFYRSSDATISTADTELGDRPILPLDANETREWSLPVLYAPSAAGTYYFGACVDPLPEEADRQNNCSVAVAVSVGGPDLVVDSLAVSESSPSAGQRFSMTARVRNQGAGATIDLTTLRFYQSADATISTADTELDTRPILTLDPGGTREWSLPALYAPSTAGTYYYGACVDPLAEETDQQNNCS
ncbi:MAG: hypothetical protein F4042_05790, partial [Gemmatimonadetes bacterium]|nr:hypothetical protein [Gemmatimonadota bacterium]